MRGREGFRVIEERKGGRLGEPVVCRKRKVRYELLGVERVFVRFQVSIKAFV